MKKYNMRLDDVKVTCTGTRTVSPRNQEASLAKVYIGAVYDGVVKETLCGTLPATIHPSQLYNVKCDVDIVGDYVKIQTGRADFKLTFSDVNVIGTGKYGGKMFNRD